MEEKNQLNLTGIFEKGYGFIAKTIMQDNSLSIQAKGLYAYFCSFSGKGNDIFPSREKICNELNISKNSFEKYLNELKEKRYIFVKQDKNNGAFSKNIYTINFNLPCTKICDTTVYQNLNDTVYQNLTPNNNIYNNNKEIDNNKLLSTKKKFIPPTLEDVKNYCEEKNFDIDYQAFYDYYNVSNWKDSEGKQVKNWKQKMITWATRRKNTQSKQIIPDWFGKEIKDDDGEWKFSEEDKRRFGL